MRETWEERPTGVPGLVIVVAVADNGVIGADGSLPWRLSADLRRVKDLTMGKPLIMGRRTYETIGRPLPGRESVVITRNPQFAPEGITVMPNFEVALVAASEVAREMGTDEVIAFGGSEIYAKALPLAKRIERTEIHLSPDGDTKFPEFDPADWIEVAREDYPVGIDGAAAHSFVTLERR